jgi:HSP20 family protein
MGGMIGGDLARLGALDIHETDSAHVFKVDVPGLSANDVKVQVKDGNLLTISGSRERTQEDKDENRHYYRQERSYGSFNRSFRLPENADAKGISANVDQGVLTVVLPKAYKSNSSTIPIGGSMGMGTNTGNNYGIGSSMQNSNPTSSTMGMGSNNYGSNNYSTPASNTGLGNNYNNGSNMGTNFKSTNMGGGMGTDINVTSSNTTPSSNVGGSNLGGGYSANNNNTSSMRDTSTTTPANVQGSSTYAK